MVLLSVKGGTRGSIPTNTFDSISSRAVSLSELRSRLSKVTQSNRTWYFIIVTKSQFESCTGSNKIQESGCNVRVVSTSPHFNTGHCTIHQPREAVQVNGLNYRGSVDPKSDPLLLDYLIKCFFLFKKRFLSTDELLSSYKQTWILHPSK